MLINELPAFETLQQSCLESGLRMLQLSGKTLLPVVQGGWATADSVRATREATHRVLKHTGVLPNIETCPGGKTQWTRINGTQDYVFAPMDGYFERHFALGDDIQKGQLAGWMHHLDRPNLKPEPVYFQSSGTLYAHGLIRHVRAGQNLVVLVENVNSPI